MAVRLPTLTLARLPADCCAAETMCMKGLILVHLGQRDEGINLVKEGMRKDLSSHICWHVWALIQKSDHKYEDALKSYVQALKFDKVRSSCDLFGRV